MKTKNRFRDMTIDDLQNEESQLRTELFNLRLGNTTKELGNVSKIKHTRRDLARLLTTVRQKEIAGEAKKG